MRTRWFGVVLAGALLLGAAACSSDDSTASTADTTLKKKDLQKALITKRDFPDQNFVPAPTATDDPVAEFFQDDSCDDELQAIKPDNAVRSEFVSTGGTVRLVNEVEQHIGRIPQVQAAFNKFLTDCRLVRTPTGDVTVQPLPLGVLGDDTQNAQILSRHDGAYSEIATVIVYNGDLMSAITLTGPRPLDRAILDRVVRDAIGKLGAVAEGV